MFYNTEQLADFIKAEIKAAIKEFLIEKETVSPTSKHDLGNTRYLTRDQIKEYLGIGLSTVDYWARIGKLNKIDFEGSTRFDRLEIDERIKSLRKYNHIEAISSFQKQLR